MRLRSKEIRRRRKREEDRMREHIKANKSPHKGGSTRSGGTRSRASVPPPRRTVATAPKAAEAEAAAPAAKPATKPATKPAARSRAKSADATPKPSEE